MRLEIKLELIKYENEYCNKKYLTLKKLLGIQSPPRSYAPTFSSNVVFKTYM